MATLALMAYDPPPAEMDRLRGSEAPRWARRLYSAYGYGVEDVPSSKVLSAVGEELHLRLESLSALIAGAEEMGWLVRFQGGTVVLHTGLPWERSERLLEEAGLLSVAHALVSREGHERLPWGVVETEEHEPAAG
jgi:hypothetical protein